MFVHLFQLIFKLNTLTIFLKEDLKLKKKKKEGQHVVARHENRARPTLYQPGHDMPWPVNIHEPARPTLHP